ncbi:MAG: NAD(P)H-hydrate dehydratase [Gammaproteobacteria bacterium]|nr:NAD(P)H-hydrate dehydratase [Gammaproteobacteria bacterium]MDA8024063.1 NAD(P)H-hydrate dehydratase [Gammaproteobacteria bacterium]
MLPAELYRARETREIDRIAIARHGAAGLELMRRAGESALRHITARHSGARHLLVVCGPGNNGGDGYVLAARAREVGMRVSVLAAGAPASEDAAAAAREYRDSGGEARDAESGAELPGDADVIADALFGTGLGRAPQGVAADLIARINAASASGRAAVFALDMPSGLGDGGRAFSPCVRAHATLTFIGLKIGLFTGDGCDQAGEVLFDDLRVPGAARRAVRPVARIISPPELPRRNRGMHKGEAGRVLVAGGARGMFGAALLSAEAALRCGAGLVTLASEAANLDLAALRRPELMSADALTANTPADIVVLGPGLGMDEWGERVFKKFIGGDARLVVDADALNWLARHPQKRADWTLTPHPGEAARLLDCDVGEVQADRLAAAHEIAARFGGVCVLKGAGTLVVDGESAWLCDRGNPGMASAGMGDVLAGTIGALLAQGASVADAVWLHSHAADLAAQSCCGERGLLAGDVLMQLPSVLKARETRAPRSAIIPQPDASL